MLNRVPALIAALALAAAPDLALAQSKISALPTASAVSATDVFPATQGACPGSCATNGVTGAQLKTWAQSGLAASATTDTTNASNISSGTLSASRGGAGTIGGALKGSGAGVVSQAAASDLSNGVTGSGAVVLATSPTLVTPTLGVAKITTLASLHAVTSITAGATAQIGTGGTAACTTSHVCDSLSGEVSLATGAGTLTAGTAFTIAFADTRANIPNCVVHLQTATAGINAVTYFYTPSTTTLVVGASNALTASTTYIFDYVCGGN